MEINITVKEMSISCLWQSGGREAVVFIHGLGASKENFVSAFRRAEFRSLTMLAPDLVGFGASDKPDDFSYLMKAQAEIIMKTIDQRGIDRFHLVAHSMGGIVGMELCDMMPGRVRLFIDVEGNLTGEDCWMSRNIIRASEEEFVQSGFARLKRHLGEDFERTGNEAGKIYLKMLSKAAARSVYRSSLSTVQESDHGDLVDRFSRFSFYKCYVYGQKNRGKFLSEKLLQERNVDLFYITESGHDPMDENPDEFYRLIVEKVTHIILNYHCKKR